MKLPLVSLDPIPLSARWRQFLAQRGFQVPLPLEPRLDRADLAARVLHTLRHIRQGRLPTPLTIFARPTTWPAELQPSDFDGVPTNIVWFGSGREKLAAFEDRPSIRLLVAETNHNAPAVAELNVSMATALLRPVHKAFAIPSSAEEAFINRHPAFVFSESLAGRVWACFGAGAQVRALLPLLLAYRVSEVRVQNRTVPRDDLARRLQGFSHTDIRAEAGGFHTVLYFGEHTLPLYFTADKMAAVAGADILSLHIPKGATGQPRAIDSALLKSLPASSIVINTARADHWDEVEIVEALQAGHLRAVASDVLSQEVEETEDFESSPLYAYARQLPAISVLDFTPARLSGGNVRIYTDRVLLTPHIGGSTEDSFEGFAGELLPKL